jgi:type IX secretion system PorP/SprF family membrane protein
LSGGSNNLYYFFVPRLLTNRKRPAIQSIILVKSKIVAVTRKDGLIKEMKRFSAILTVLLFFVSAYTQQIPMSENYYLDKYSFAPSYAGNYNPGYIFLGYRSDWSGIKGGPETFRLSFSNSALRNAGYGAKIIYDRAGIFNQIYLLGSYSYKVRINEDHNLLFGISCGLYNNTLNIIDYYNDPNYNIDPSLISQRVNSKLKFMSDVSLAWSWKGLEAGFFFTNISFGDAHYKDVDVKYNPVTNYQVHAAYDWKVAEDWEVEPLFIVRGGKYVPSQMEIATRVMYRQKLWGSIVFRDPGIFGAGIGCKVGKGIMLNYNFNFATNVALNIFNNHEFCLGINIFDLAAKKEEIPDI